MSDIYFLRVWVIGTDVKAVHTSTEQIDFEFTTISGAVIYDLVIDGVFANSDVAFAALVFDGTDFSGLSIANQALMAGV